MAKAQRMVRVDVDVLERLQAYQDRLRVAVGVNPAAGPEHEEWRDVGPWLSLSGVIAHLLDKVDAHAERRRKSRRNTRKKGGQP